MLKKTLLLLTTLMTLLLTPLASQAAIVDNGTFTTDSVTGKDWLDIDIAWGDTLTEVNARLSSSGDLFGWGIATQAEVVEFWSNAGITSSGAFSSTYYATINALIAKLSGTMTFGTTGTSWHSGDRLQGLVADGFSSYSWAPAMNINYADGIAYANDNHYQPYSSGFPNWGYWLSRDTQASSGFTGTVSEPFGIGLLLIGLAVLLLTRKSKHQ